MIPRPTVTKGDRTLVTGCIFALFPIVLILVLVLLLHSALKSCSRPQAEPAPTQSPVSPQPRPSADHQLVDTANALADATVQSDAFQKATDVAGTAIQIAAAFPTAVLTHALTNMANDLVAKTPALHTPPAPPVPEVPAVPAVPPTPTTAEPPPLSTPAPEPPPPAPHLRHIRWGMTPAEVRAAESPAAPLRTTATTLVYSTTTLDLPCLLSYTFRNGRLATARLQFSLPSTGDIPALSPVAAHAAYLWLRSQLAARYGDPTSETHATRPRDTTHLADRAARSREDADQYAATLETARRRLADRTAQLREKYRNWPEAAARIDRELASERRYVADLEAWIADTRAAEKSAQTAIDQSRRDDATSPLSARDTALWLSPALPHTVTLEADYTTLPSRLEIRYKTTLPLLSPDGTSDL